ncbi:signal peptidase I [Planctomyces sp. SH-PL62]|uniref:signal peptidase I n=1 Tax=Planctomyces sp. SH-PL62 TaxID=1636152 RepID=UPI00078E2C03|nr:signal peptidase I [Planctomyces sp. SH-PL62]AMV36932.1 signal peptidase I [Planctomyces sp. SH-PL62]
MDATPSIQEPADVGEAATAGVARQTVDLLVALCLGVLLFRTFSAEAYVVPTGSMAPTLLGHHRELTCANCQFPFDVGLDEEAPPARPVCPNCGRAGSDAQPVVACNGDRVLVQKFLYDFRAPGRWEVAVFHFPGDPSQAYVKRVVGLPGESIRIAGGDVWVDGVVARKSLQDVRAMRILVHDSRYVPADSDRYPRWSFRRGTTARPEPTGWTQGPDGFRRAATEPEGDAEDWLTYRNWDPALDRYAPIRDFYGYNGGDSRSDNAVRDVGLEARVALGPGVESLAVSLRSGGDRFVVRIPTRPEEPVEVVRNGARRKVFILGNPLASDGGAETTHTLEASLFDDRLMVAVDGSLLFEPLDYDDPDDGPGNDESPIALGVRGGTLHVPEVRIFRDVHYTSSLGAAHRRPHAVLDAYRLGEGEYFVLGDNSPISNDSRFWAEGPVVPRSLFLGKPFLVHLPGKLVALEVMGRSFYWIPDPRRIRYIH